MGCRLGEIWRREMRNLCYPPQLNKSSRGDVEFPGGCDLRRFNTHIWPARFCNVKKPRSLDLSGLESAPGFSERGPFYAKTPPEEARPGPHDSTNSPPLVGRGRIFHLELSEKADVAAAIVRSAHPLPVECLGDAVPSTEDASPVPSGQVQINPVGLTGAYFGGPASPSSSAR